MAATACPAAEIVPKLVTSSAVGRPAESYSLGLDALTRALGVVGDPGLLPNEVERNQ